MNLRYKPKGIFIVEPVSRLYAAFGVMPLFDFHKRKISSKTQFKCYACCLAFLMTMACVGSVYLRFQHIHLQSRNIVKVMDVLVEAIGLVMVLVIIFGSSFWNMDVCQELISRSCYLENVGNLNLKGWTKTSILKNPFTFFVLGNVYLILSCFYQIFCLDTYHNFYYYITKHVSNYVRFLLVNLVFNVAHSIKNKYAGINNMLITSHHYHVLDTNEILHKIKTLYLETGKIVDAFNALFGWPLLLIFTYSIMDMLTALVFVISGGFTRQPILQAASLTSIPYGIEVMVSFVVVIFSCDSVQKESNKLLTNCFILEESMKLVPKEIAKLDRLRNLIKNKRPEFTAADFFQIKRSTLLSILATINTYLIVIIQFISISN